jgi:hypothetical protein
MDNDLTRWIKKHKHDPKEVKLEDVTPLHPNDYPAKHLKEKLDARRDELHEIEDRGHATGMPEGPGGF